MRIIISGIVIAVLVTALSAPVSAFALPAYQSGFNHGVSDGKDICMHPDGCH